MSRRLYAAGVWEQSGYVVWSRHSTRLLAERAARRYARAANARTGGARSWAGGIQAPDGSITWIDRAGGVKGES